MRKQTIWILSRTCDGDVIIDGAFTSEKKAETYRNQLLKEFGVGQEEWEYGGTEYDYTIDSTKLQ